MERAGVELRLRLASRADEPEVAQIYHQGWHEAHAAIVPAVLLPDRTMETFQSKVPAMLDQCVVAESEGCLVGFAAWKGPELAQLFIDPRRQGLGIASRLLERAEATMRSYGVGAAFLTCVVGNERARSFYLRRGWSQVGTENYPAKVKGEIVLVPVWRMIKDLGR